jgi:hypothetical protein
MEPSKVVPACHDILVFELRPDVARPVAAARSGSLKHTESTKGLKTARLSVTRFAGLINFAARRRLGSWEGSPWRAWGCENLSTSCGLHLVVYTVTGRLTLEFPRKGLRTLGCVDMIQRKLFLKLKRVEVNHCFGCDESKIATPFAQQR